MTPPPIWASAVLTGIVGLAVGSFLNVVAYRLPAGKSLLRPGSACPVCAAPIRPWDNVPVVSWLALRGRCRSCSTRIPWSYPALELLTGVVFAAVGARFPWSALDAPFLVFAAGGIAVAAIDLAHRVIPRRIVYPVAGAGLVAFSTMAAVEGQPGRLAVALGAGAAAFAAFFAVHWWRPAGMGFGDVRLAGLVGLFVGWLGAGEVFVAILAAFVLGAAVGIPYAALTGGGRRAAMPFGPFLAGGATLALLVGPQLVHLWLGRLA